MPATGAPVLDDAVAAFDYVIADQVEASTHTIVICDVVGLRGPTVDCGRRLVEVSLGFSPPLWSGALSATVHWNRGGQGISGATGLTDTPTTSDVGQTLSVTVVATNATGSTTVTSAGVGPVRAAS